MFCNFYTTRFIKEVRNSQIMLRVTTKNISNPYWAFIIFISLFCPSKKQYYNVEIFFIFSSLFCKAVLKYNWPPKHFTYLMNNKLVSLDISIHLRYHYHNKGIKHICHPPIFFLCSSVVFFFICCCCPSLLLFFIRILKIFSSAQYRIASYVAQYLLHFIDEELMCREMK